MVADKVVINSLSMNEGAKATKWTCQGDTDYEFSDSVISLQLEQKLRCTLMKKTKIS
jgi:HSP90 family molecular chaperone